VGRKIRNTRTEASEQNSSSRTDRKGHLEQDNGDGNKKKSTRTALPEKDRKHRKTKRTARTIKSE
jgi:hypothetical protein